MVETTAYLMAAEAIANAARHAHATECTLRVADEGDRLTRRAARQRHRRRGRPRRRRAGVMSDRAAAIGARCFLESPRGGGTAVRIEIPVER